jgi:uncharacterized repeat protein (TIGR03843 family)
MSSHKRQSSTEALAKLAAGEIEIVGRLPWSSNFTFLVDVVDGDEKTRAVYKPLQGEQELWDFPPEIYKREVAAYELSVALDWPNIPPTIIRDEGPFDVGSLQLFMPSDFEEHYFTMYEAGLHHDDFMRIAAFDIIANNTDRKAGHCLGGDDGNIYAIDNGLCFHEDPKLRTVIWEFQGTPIPDELLADIERIGTNPPTSVTDLLLENEVEALLERIQETLENPVFPQLVSQKQYPWPIV